MEIGRSGTPCSDVATDNARPKLSIPKRGVTSTLIV